METSQICEAESRANPHTEICVLSGPHVDCEKDSSFSELETTEICEIESKAKPHAEICEFGAMQTLHKAVRTTMSKYCVQRPKTTMESVYMGTKTLKRHVWKIRA